MTKAPDDLREVEGHALVRFYEELRHELRWRWLTSLYKLVQFLGEKAPYVSRFACEDTREVFVSVIDLSPRFVQEILKPFLKHVNKDFPEFAQLYCVDAGEDTIVSPQMDEYPSTPVHNMVWVIRLVYPPGDGSWLVSYFHGLSCDALLEDPIETKDGYKTALGHWPPPTREVLAQSTEWPLQTSEDPDAMEQIVWVGTQHFDSETPQGDEDGPTINVAVVDSDGKPVLRS